MAVVCLAATPAAGQRQVPAWRVASAEASFAAASSAGKLRCDLRSVRPQLNYAFRFRAGYTVEIPPAQVPRGRRDLVSLIRVTPQNGKPVYFAANGERQERQRAAQSDDGETPAPATGLGIAGWFVVGEGSYRVEVLVQDRQLRACRGAWNIEARRTGSERQMKMTLAPGAVEEYTTSNVSGPGVTADGSKIGKLTILVHASPLPSSRLQLQPSDIRRLLTELFSMLVQLPVQSVRVIGFNIDQREVIFRKDDFTAARIEELRPALEHLQLAKVDYEVLRRPEKPIELLLRLLEDELADSRPPDGVIVLGSRPRSSGGASAEALSGMPASAPPIFYLQNQMAPILRYPIDGFLEAPTPRGRGAGGGGGGANGRGSSQGSAATLMPSGGIDSIGDLMKHVKGQTITFRTPHEFADAILRVESRIAPAAPQAEAQRK